MRREVAGYHKETRMAVYGQVLAERGEPFPAEEPSR